MPNVATTKACVSPLVNKAEPWALGRVPTSATIGLTVLVSLPSILFLVFNIFPLTMSDSRSFIRVDASVALTVSPNLSKISLLISFQVLERLDLSFSL